MFYFHVFNDFDSRDEEGQELPSLDAAREVAISECRILAAESVEEGHLDLAHRIDVHDKDDSLLFSVSFGDAVRIDAS